MCAGLGSDGDDDDGKQGKRSDTLRVQVSYWTIVVTVGLIRSEMNH